VATVSLNRQTSQLGGNQIPSSSAPLLGFSFGIHAPLSLSLAMCQGFVLFPIVRRPATSCFLDDVILRLGKADGSTVLKEMRERNKLLTHQQELDRRLTHRCNKQFESSASFLPTLWRLGENKLSAFRNHFIPKR